MTISKCSQYHMSIIELSVPLVCIQLIWLSWQRNYEETSVC